uniref:RRM domain-containing protein n=1 Tax=Anopheles maculatus TaxID=74869 RepID=A0A182SNS0_9DIPT
MDDDSMGQFNPDDNCDDFSPAQDQQDYEEEYSPLLVYRRDVRFGKLRFQTENKTSVKVENIPREVYDEDVVIYFQKFGPILSIERGICLNALFSKLYTINYLNEESQQRALNCFCRQVVLSDITCTIFTMIPGEALHPVKNQSVLISYLPNFVLYDEIVQAFSDIGNVLYVEKKVRNNGPTIVHFTHPINMNDACQIDSIADIKVTILPVTQKDFVKFACGLPAFQRAAKGKLIGTPKGNYLQEIEAKEEQEKKDNIIFKTGFNPHYRNPNPNKYSFEVVLYNCPKPTKLGMLKGYFNRAGAVLAMRKEPSMYDQHTWKVYVSFANYLEAYRAVRLKGKVGGDLIFKHIAAESPRLDCMEAVMVTVESEESLSLAQVARVFVKCGVLYFAEKTAEHEFILIYRDIRGAQRACEVPTVDRHPVDVFWMKDVVKQKGKQKIVGFKMSAGPHAGVVDDPKDNRPRVLLSDIFAAKEPKEDTDSNKKDQPISAPVVAPKPPPPVAPRADPLTVEIINEACDTPKPSTSSASPPPVDIKEEDLRNVIVEKRSIKSECQDQLNSLEEMERYIKQKEQDIQRRLQQLEKDEANVTALLPSSSTSSSKRVKSSEENAKESTSSRNEPTGGSSRASGSSNQRLSSPIRKEPSSSSSSNHQRISTHTTAVGGGSSSSSIPTYPSSDSMMLSDQMRSVSPSDRLAHERYMQIRVEKIAITQELDSLRQRFDYRKGSRVDAETPQQTLHVPAVPFAGVSFTVPFAVPSPFTIFSITLTLSDIWQDGTLTLTDLWKDRTLTLTDVWKDRTFTLTDLWKDGTLTLTLTDLWKDGTLTLTVTPFGTQAYTVSHSLTTVTIFARLPFPISTSTVRASDATAIKDSITRRITRTAGRKAGLFYRSVYVGNVSKQVSEREIEEMFARFGRLSNKDFVRLKRYGEVYFDYANREHAFKALEMNNVKLAGRRLRVAFNSDKPSIREGYSLYFTLRQPSDEQIIYRTYESYGEIDFIWYPENETIGTISFRRTEAATNALAVYKLIDGTPIKSRPFVDRVNVERVALN